jgi:hypothetical protein
MFIKPPRPGCHFQTLVLTPRLMLAHGLDDGEFHSGIRAKNRLGKPDGFAAI